MRPYCLPHLSHLAWTILPPDRQSTNGSVFVCPLRAAFLIVNFRKRLVFTGHSLEVLTSTDERGASLSSFMPSLLSNQPRPLVSSRTSDGLRYCSRRVA